MFSLRLLLRRTLPKGYENQSSEERLLPFLFKSLPLVGASILLCDAVQRNHDGNEAEIDATVTTISLQHHPSSRKLAKIPIPLFHPPLSIASCEGLLEVETVFPGSFNESDRFFQVLEYHRTLLPDYTNRWATADPPPAGHKTWPRNVPKSSDITALEMDYAFCRRSPNYRNKDRACQDLQFRIGCYYITTYSNRDGEMQMKGYKMIKDLAEQGHPDGMCYYGIILNEGLVQGIDASPEKAVIWWSRCLDFHKHIWSTYELAVAFYTGEGVPEDTVRAVSYFRKAAHLGHAGAAYMLGELLLDGVGVRRDRASALEWIVTAAELGHYKARQRVLSILQQDWEDLELGNAQADKEEETLQWSGMSDEEKAKAILIERRYTIGGGSRNPEVLQKRKTKVMESREEG